MPNKCDSRKSKNIVKRVFAPATLDLVGAARRFRANPPTRRGSGLEGVGLPAASVHDLVEAAAGAFGAAATVALDGLADGDGADELVAARDVEAGQQLLAVAEHT